MQGDSSFIKRFKIEFILLGVLACVCLGYVVDAHPIRISRSDTPGAASMPQQLGQSNILLILPDTTQTAESYPEMDFSFAWYNAMSQVIGPFSIALTRQIQSSEDLAQARLIVIPQNAAEQMNEAQIQSVAQSVQLGASLILEMPGHAWAPVTGMRLNTRGNATIKRVTDAPNSPLSGTYKDHLLNTPIDTRVMRMDASNPEALPSNGLLLEIDGAIAHAKRSLGAGIVHILGFNFGQAMTSLQQGRPSDAFRIDGEESPRTSDLILNERMRTNTVPYADLLKMHVFGSAFQAAPFPMLWPIANGKKSALIVSHETGNLGDEAFSSAKYELEFGAHATWLATASTISSETLRKYASEGFDIGASIYRPPADRIDEPWGIAFFKPIAFEQTVADQRRALMQQISSPISTCKYAKNVWSRDYTAFFRYLTAAQCQIDLSYGPGTEGDYGYLFGSSYPFLPIERNGLPFPVYALPTTIDDGVGLGLIPEHAPLQMLKDAESTWNGPIVVNFSATAMQETPSYLSPQTWHELLAYAKENDVLMPSAKSFMQHYTLRKQSHLLYTWNPNARTLQAQVRLPKADFSYTLAIPKRTQAGALDTLWLDKRQLDIEAGKTSSDGLLLLIPLEASEHSIEAHYQ